MSDLTREGFDITVYVKPDEHTDPPWVACDGHGPVSEWTTREKAPGERILSSARGSRRYYDVAGAMDLAKKGGWGTKGGRKLGETANEYAARAVAADFDYLRGWCDDDWHYVGVIVTASRAGVELGSASLWGIEGGDEDYVVEVGAELVTEAINAAQTKLAQLCLCEGA